MVEILTGWKPSIIEDSETNDEIEKINIEDFSFEESYRT